MKINLSVVICTRNPTYLSRTLSALRNQDLAYHEWELIIVDNGSKNPISEAYDLSWHPNCTVILDSRTGVQFARETGIKSSRGDLIVFVDDDNILRGDYLREAVAIAQEQPLIGAFGGRLIGEFEKPLPAHLARYASKIAVIDLQRDLISNLYMTETTPPGAGMVIRRQIAEAYYRAVSSQSFQLGQRGEILLRGEDTDMAWTAIDMGFLTGRFTRLHLTHIIPATRVEEDYLARLTAGVSVSGQMLLLKRGMSDRFVYTNLLSLRSKLYDMLLLLRGDRFELKKRGYIRELAMLVKDDLQKLLDGRHTAL